MSFSIFRMMSTHKNVFLIFILLICYDYNNDIILLKQYCYKVVKNPIFYFIVAEETFDAIFTIFLSRLKTL